MSVLSDEQEAAAARKREEAYSEGLMAQSAVVRDYRVLEIGRRRANRLVLTVAG